MPGHVRQGFVGLSTRRRTTGYHPYTMLALNLLSQLVCVSGVNQLSSVSKNQSIYISSPPPLRHHLLPLSLPLPPRPSPPNKLVPVSDCNTTEAPFLLTTPFPFQRVSAVSTQVVLTARKAISLCFSVWWFSSGWNGQFACGAFMVFVGSLWYSILPALAQSTTPVRKKQS